MANNDALALLLGKALLSRNPVLAQALAVLAAPPAAPAATSVPAHVKAPVVKAPKLKPRPAIGKTGNDLAALSTFLQNSLGKIVSCTYTPLSPKCVVGTRVFVPTKYNDCAGKRAMHNDCVWASKEGNLLVFCALYRITQTDSGGNPVEVAPVQHGGKQVWKDYRLSQITSANVLTEA